MNENTNDSRGRIGNLPIIIYRRSVRISLALVAAMMTLDICAQTPIVTEFQQVIAADSDEGDLFGTSVSVDDGKLLVGAIADSDIAPFAGAAYVFEYVAGEWVEVSKLTASDGASGDQFGSSVSVSGSQLVVGAWVDDTLGNNSGSAYVFEKVGADYVQTAEVVASDGEAGDLFGRSVSLMPHRFAVGAPDEDSLGFGAGAVYVFDLIGDEWLEVAKLTASDGMPFGQFISLDGNCLAVSAQGQQAVYVFEEIAGSWIEVQRLTPTGGVGGTAFGSAVSLQGDHLAVGADSDDEVAPNAGAAFVFERQGLRWIQIAKLTPSDGATLDRFGYSIAIEDGTVVVGSYRSDHGGLDSGSLYVFERDPELDSWVEVAKLTASDGGPEDELGFSLAVEDRTVVSGAREFDGAGPCIGAVYHFAISKFVRGDANSDGQRDISDVIFQLSALFLAGSSQPVCMDAADVNDDGTLDLGDPIYLLTALFTPGFAPIPSPGICGFDPTVDMISCAEFPQCP